MARIKKAKNGDPVKPQRGFTLSEAKRKRDSLDYDAKTSMAAARQRTLGSKGYDDISQELTKRARRSDSLRNVFDRAIERATKKATPKQRNGGKTPAWQRKEGKNPEGGLNAKGVASYRKANPGSKLKTAVTTKPSKLKPGSKAASRRKSFCSRMSGMKKKLTSAKTANDPNSRINKSLRKWNC